VAFIIVVSLEGAATLLSKEEWEAMVTRTDYVSPDGSKWIILPHVGKPIMTPVKPSKEEV
jgi:hypothetical protein